MRRVILTLLAVVPALGLWAQSMHIYQGSVVTMANATDVESITFNDSTTLVVNGILFPVSEIDSIVVNDEVIKTDSVIVKYASTSAQVFVPINVAKYLTTTVNGANVSIISSQSDETALTDTTEIKYALSGSTLKGSFYQEGAYKCTLVLNGVSIISSEGAAIQMQNGKRIDVIVADGTTNTLKDKMNGLQKACFAIKGHAEFKGGGTLNIYGQGAHGYKSNEYTILKKTFTGNLNIKSAVNDAMHIGQYFQMNNGNITITNPSGDALQVEATNNAADEMNGQMILNSGNINITSKADDVDGLKCDSAGVGKLTVTGGTYTINMSGLGAKGVDAYQAEINETTAPTLFTITVSGDRYIDPVTGDKNKSTGFKTDDIMRFTAGTINVTATGDRARGIKVGYNYYYTKNAKTNVTPDVDGMMYLE